MPPAILKYEMVEHFGSLSEYQEADYWEVKQAELVWQAQQAARAEQDKRDEAEYERRQLAAKAGM